MTETSNPFAAPERQVKGASRSSVFAWCLAIAALAGTGVFGLLWWQDRQKHESDLQVLRAELAKTGTDLAGALNTLQTNRQTLIALTNQIGELEKEKEAVGQTARSLEDEMRQQLESKDVTISKLQGKLTVTIVDRVMFDSGEAILKPDGATVMQKIADLLTAHPTLKIHVIGHTDNVPIRQTAQSRFASNWELSTARALAAVHFLTEKAGVDPHRVGAVGYGEFRPIADNSTPEGRARNRRIAITILPEELADPESLPMVSSTPSTDAPPTTANEVIPDQQISSSKP